MLSSKSNVNLDRINRIDKIWDLTQRRREAETQRFFYGFRSRDFSALAGK